MNSLRLVSLLFFGRVSFYCRPFVSHTPGSPCLLSYPERSLIPPFIRSPCAGNYWSFLSPSCPSYLPFFFDASFFCRVFGHDLFRFPGDCWLHRLGPVLILFTSFPPVPFSFFVFFGILFKSLAPSVGLFGVHVWTSCGYGGIFFCFFFGGPQRPVRGPGQVFRYHVNFRTPAVFRQTFVTAGLV